MKLGRTLRGVVVGMSYFSFLATQLAHAAGPVQQANTSQPLGAGASVVRDVALGDGGILMGQVVDKQGAPRVAADVKVGKQGSVVATATTDADGRFQVRGLPAGVYQLETAAAGGVFRLWAPRTAPPSALSAAMLVSGDEVARGQGQRPVLGFLTNPWVLGGIVATAIVLPLALDDDDAS